MSRHVSYSREQPCQSERPQKLKRTLALIGLWVGFPHVLWALTLGILAGAVTTLVLLLTRRWNLTGHIPYAPFLCLGTVLSLLGVPFFFVLRI